MKGLTIITPPHVETAITGFRLGAERKIGKHNWRIEFFDGEPAPRYIKDGVRITLQTRHDITTEVLDLANAAAKYLPPRSMG